MGAEVTKNAVWWAHWWNEHTPPHNQSCGGARIDKHAIKNANLHPAISSFFAVLEFFHLDLAVNELIYVDDDDCALNIKHC